MRTCLLLTLIALFTFFSCEQKVAIKEEPFSIQYEKFILDNGLEVVLHEDHSDPIVAVATLLHVGSNREEKGRTGFAHFFEHMSFNDSENVPVGANRKLIPEWGGSRNGGTWSDGTIYYEVVPKDAFEKILWIDSDRLGYMINTVTESALEREKQVVKNEKRQRVDNAAYGFTDEVIRKNLYPEDHPYNWTVIGQLPDLQAATLDDVKEFYDKYYGAGNASLVIAGDIDIEKTKELVKQWFGEIRKGPEVQTPEPRPVTLRETKSFYFQDNFAKLPELRMVYPTVEEYHEDAYALNVLGQLLSGSKKSPLYKVIVEEQKLAPGVGSYQSSNEIAGEFVVRVRANAGVDLDSVKAALEKGFTLFESEGFSDSELERIKAELETNLYQGIATVLNKAFTMVIGNEFAGDPAYVVKEAEFTNAVTREDVMRVYETYLKGKNFVMTSFVPKDQLDLAKEGSNKAEVWEEEIVADVDSEEVSQGEEAEYEKTPTEFDRSEPDFGELPLFKMPEIWTSTLATSGVKVYGIENNEIPLVNFDVTLKGGHWLDPLEKAGVANLLTDLMMEGTATKTPAELEEAIGLLGASINMYSGNEEIRISGTCLSKNFESTVALVEEILMEPRWDEKEYERLKRALETQLKGNEANPNSIASNNFDLLLYGKGHILGLPASGTPETAANITLDDLKYYYKDNFSPTVTAIHVAGSIPKDRVEKAFSGLDQRWEPIQVEIPEYEITETGNDGKLFFVDIPDAKQSVLRIGKLVMAETDPDYNNLSYVNEKLGGGSSGQLFQILRIEKGYTYGAYSFLGGGQEVGPFTALGSVRTNATKPSLEIIIDLLKNYGENFTDEDVETTKNKLLKENTRNYESLGAKLGILRNISKYGKPMNYIEINQDELVNMTLDNFKALISRYLVEEEMIYLVVGDKATQMQEINTLGKGQAIELDIYGDPVNVNM